MNKSSFQMSINTITFAKLCLLDDNSLAPKFHLKNLQIIVLLLPSIIHHPAIVETMS